MTTQSGPDVYVELPRLAVGRTGFPVIGGHQGRMSMAWFCPGCGKVWARIHRGQGWLALHRWCEDCPSQQSTVGGSLLQNYEWYGNALSGEREFLAENPELLAYEFDIHIRWAERQLAATSSQEGIPV